MVILIYSLYVGYKTHMNLVDFFIFILGHLIIGVLIGYILTNLIIMEGDDPHRFLNQIGR